MTDDSWALAAQPLCAYPELQSKPREFTKHQHEQQRLHGEQITNRGISFNEMCVPFAYILDIFYFCIALCCHLFLQVRLFVKCILMRFSLFLLIDFMHIPVKYAVACEHYRENTWVQVNAIHSSTGWRMGRSRQAGRATRKRRHKQDSLTQSGMIALQPSQTFLFWPLTSPVFFSSRSVSPAAVREADEVSPRTGLHL